MINKLDESQLFLCRFVSDLFEYSTKVKECSSKTFVKSFVYSSLAKKVSNKSFFINSIDISLAYDLIKKEKKLNRGKDIYPSYVMSWIGYIMEYFTLSTNIPLEILYKNIKPEELYSLYEAYHSLDSELVIKRIIESKNINTNLNNVELYKAI